MGERCGKNKAGSKRSSRVGWKYHEECQSSQRESLEDRVHKSSFDHAEGENMSSGQLVSKYKNVQRNEKTESH